MIDIDALRPIIEPLLTDENTASVLEAIAAIDNDDFISRAELQTENEKYHTERMKKLVWGKEKPASVDTQPETPKKPQRFEDLFKQS